MPSISNAAISIPSPLEYQGKRFVTFAMVDELHQRPAGTAKNTFSRNKRRFVEGRDYSLYSSAKYVKRTICLFEFGYLLLVKPFSDDLSWKIQVMLAEGYFRQGQAQPLEYLSAKMEPEIRERVRGLLDLDSRLSTKEISDAIKSPLARRAVYELRETRRRPHHAQLALPGMLGLLA